MVHSHDETMYCNQDKDIRIFLIVCKFDIGNIQWCFYGMTHLEITYVSVKFKLLHGESHKASSLCTYKLRCVPDLNEQNNENQKHFKGLLCDLCFLGIHQRSTVQRYLIYRLTEYIRHMFTTKSLKGNLLIHMQLNFTYKAHMFFHAYVLTIAFPIHVGDCWV